MPEPLPTLYTVDELSAMFTVPQRVVREWVRAKHLTGTAVPRGGRYRATLLFTDDDVDRFIETHQAEVFSDR